LLAACQGTIEPPSGVGGNVEPATPGPGPSNPGAGASAQGGSVGVGAGGSDAAISGSTGVGAGSPGDPANLASNPSLAEIATRYFPGQVAVPAPKRVFRLTRMQLDNTTQALLPDAVDASALSTLPPDRLQTNYEYSDNLEFNPSNFTPLTNWVAEIAARVKANPTSVIDCTASNDSATCLAEQAKRFVSRAFRGTLTDAELSRYATFFTESAQSVGVPTATADLVDVTLTSPRYLFRDEVATDASGALRPAHALQHLTYTLADVPPDALGFSSAAPDAFVQSVESTRETIDAVLASAEARAKLLRFFMAWLEVKQADEFTISGSAFPEFTAEVAAAVVDETSKFLERQLGGAAPRMKDLTESTQGFVSNASAFLYGNDVEAGSLPVELDPAERLGIFTQAAVIASHSGPTTSRLVKRGVFFVRKVMCMPLGSPPPGTDTTVPDAPSSTERERVESVTAVAPCNGCHTFINPFGFMLENYDAIGRYRTREEGGPIDPNISVDFLDEGPFEAGSPVEALRAFTRSYRFQQCFVRQLFRFYLGREETAGDDPLLRQMFFDFANEGEQDIVRLLHTLANAPAFSRRSEVP
jgi:hypothetical protein